MTQLLKLEKIAYYEDYIAKCNVCNKKIKRAYYTNQGCMGIDCFLAAIGLPRIRTTTKKSPILTAEQYESLAEGMIHQLEAMTDADWTAYWTQYFTSDVTEVKSIRRLGLNFAIHYIHRCNDRKDQFNLLILHRDHVARLTGVPMDMMDKIMDSKYYNQYYFRSVKQCGEYTCLM